MNSEFVDSEISAEGERLNSGLNGCVFHIYCVDKTANHYLTLFYMVLKSVTTNVDIAVNLI